MLIASLPLLLASLAITVQAGSAVEVFNYNKRPGDLLALELPYSTTEIVRALVQMDSVETWFALASCETDTCEAIDPTYSATPISSCTLAAHYQCAVVGRGKPFVQSIIANVNEESDVIDQSILAVDYLNSNFPDTSSDFPTAATGVAGLGPICSRSCLARKFDTEDYSASILQNLFKFRYSTLGDQQEFYFRRVVGLYGSNLNQDDQFFQDQSVVTDARLIPIIRGACAWTFRISSSIKISRDDGKPLEVRRPATITYDPTYDFNIVNQEMAQAYAQAFASYNNYQVSEVDLGDLRVFRYWQNTVPSSNPVFPGLGFEAISANDSDLVLDFAGLQGAHLPDPDYLYYLPFAYRKAAPCCGNWILGYPAINDDVDAAATDYNYPKMVVRGTSTGIQSYYIQLKA